MILIIDFGSQTTHLIGRRLKEFGVPISIVQPQQSLSEIKKTKPAGLILSGGPSSVYEKGAPSIDEKIFTLGIPILGICYGMMLMPKLLGGKVIPGRKEYGPASLNIAIAQSPISTGLPNTCTVWMSHGDEVTAIPPGFVTVGSTDYVPYAFVQNAKDHIYGVQFHPEVEHTQGGDLILKNFINICNITTQKQEIDINAIIQDIKEKVGNDYVIGAVSGGVDSTVAGVLTAKAIGKQFIPVFVDNGLMRPGTPEDVKKIFLAQNIEPAIIDVAGEMLAKLKGLTDPEKKRKTIGGYYIRMFEAEMDILLTKNIPVKFLMQGTIYSDVIESKGTQNAAKIKSHHNVGGLPKDMKLELLEPLRYFYKDEVRRIGKLLDLPDEFVHKQVFPGPGYAVRIRGEVTPERLAKEKQADTIVLEEIKKAGWLPKVYMSYPIMTGASSTAVKGDGRFFGEVIALRVIESLDVMTAAWSHLPYELLQKISSRIVNEVPAISRVVYDITTKPPDVSSMLFQHQ